MIIKSTWTLIAVFAALGSLKAAENPEQPIIINDPNWPPFFHGGATDQPEGFAKEIIMSCLNELKVPFVFKFHPIKRMRVNMEQGLIDINIYSYKASRETFLEYGEEKLFTSAYIPFIHKNSDIKITSIADFDNLKLGHQIGLRYSKDFYHYILKRKKLRTIDEAPNSESNIRKLIHKRIDVFVGSRGTIPYIAKNLGLEGQVKPVDFIIKSSDYFVTVSKKSPRIPDKALFLKRTSQCIQEMKKNGKYCEFAKKYELPCRFEKLN